MRMADKCDSSNELLTLLAIGNFTDEGGRGCYASRQTLADQALISRETVKRCIPRLSTKGLILPGDLKLVEHVRADRRPEVWDLLGAVDRASTGGLCDPPYCTARGLCDPPMADGGSGGPLATRAEGSNRPTGGHGDPQSFKEREEISSLSPTQKLIRNAELGLTEGEETSFIAYADTIGSTGRKGSAWWRKVETEGDLPGLVADWRATQTATSPAPRASPTRACTNCGTRFTPADTTAHECTDCHAERAP